MSNEIDIRKLKYPDNIREKPGMYIGSTTHPTVINREVIDNIKDEIMNNYCTKAIIDLDNDTHDNIALDNGRGIPIYKDPDHDNQEITIDLFTTTHVGGKFDAGEATTGTHGVGVKATNALSEYFTVLVNVNKNRSTKEKPKWIEDELVGKSNPIYYLRFERGILKDKGVIELSSISSIISSKKHTDFLNDDWWATAICWKPDDIIFEHKNSRYNIVELKLTKLFSEKSEIIYNGKDVGLFDVKTDLFPQDSFIDNRIFKIESSYEGTYLFQNKTERTNKTKFILTFGFSAEDFKLTKIGSVNTLDCKDGYHTNLGVRLLGRAVNEKYPEILREDIEYGLRIFVLTITNSAIYSSQEKVKLDTISGLHENTLYESIKSEVFKIIADNKDFFEALKMRILEYKRTIGKLALKDYIQSVVIMGDSKKSKGLGTEIYDCSSGDITMNEIMLCEGKSAAGTIRDARDSRFTAILPLRGKVLNAAQVGIEDALNNKEMKSIINCLGVGIHPYVDLTKTRYGKVIIAADADIDGLHIASLLLGAFAAHLPEVIEAGMLYIAEAPLFKQDDKYFWSQDEEGFNPNKKFSRFKGLGSMSSEDFEKSLCNFETRRLIKVTVDDIDKALNLVRSSVKKKELMVRRGVLKLEEKRG